MKINLNQARFSLEKIGRSLSSLPLDSQALHALSLLWAEMHDDDAETLAASPLLAAFDSVDLSFNSISNNGAKSLAASPYLQNAKVLRLAANHIEEEGAFALASSPFLSNLTLLDLQENLITRDGNQALSFSPWLKNCDISLYLSDVPGFQRLCILKNPLKMTWACMEEDFWKKREESLKTAFKSSCPSLDWQLFAYALLPPARQAIFYPTLLSIALRTSPSFSGDPKYSWERKITTHTSRRVLPLLHEWCLSHLLTWKGAFLEKAVALFPNIWALREQLEKEQKRLFFLENALF